jgi:hypothetical protein
MPTAEASGRSHQAEASGRSHQAEASVNRKGSEPRRGGVPQSEVKAKNG